ncbi:hypothetical protein [Oscillatoria sp. FACHB-1406]|uniref:hypothetical protein n=1 Tax=Oscillatoria sp. FACHB-1406 TaxID=2692846 RepID=UPI0016853432|nr:hypothetical protein [Oscillatoria sp. FACHB-1406]MBD2580583.1 hypothetical protein [Oscillatoria sp. FACHB-1406]
MLFPNLSLQSSPQSAIPVSSPKLALASVSSGKANSSEKENSPMHELLRAIATGKLQVIV